MKNETKEEKLIEAIIQDSNSCIIADDIRIDYQAGSIYIFDKEANAYLFEAPIHCYR